jgi:hypothetical protein
VEVDDMSDVNGQSERRHHSRREAELPLRYRETLAARSSYLGVQMKDVGSGGVKFQTEGFIPLNTSLICEFSLPESFRPVRAISRVAWSRKLPLGDRYEIGSEFLEIVPTEKRILEEFLSARKVGAS